jgi:hypothetical protein
MLGVPLGVVVQVARDSKQICLYSFLSDFALRDPGANEGL